MQDMEVVLMCNRYENLQLDSFWSYNIRYLYDSICIIVPSENLAKVRKIDARNVCVGRRIVHDDEQSDRHHPND